MAVRSSKEARPEALRRRKDFASESFHHLVHAAASEEELLDDGAIAEAEAMAREEKQRAAIEYVKTLHVEPFALCMYITLCVLLSSVVVLYRNGQYDFYFGEMVRKLVLRSYFDNADTEIAMTFNDVASLDDIYKFLRGPLLAALYVETTLAGVPLPPSQMRHVIDGNNLLLGLVRLQQVRVRVDSCAVPSYFEVNGSSATTIAHCYAALPRGKAAEDRIDREPIVGQAAVNVNGGQAAGGGAPRTYRYEWMPSSVTKLGPFAGIHHQYDGAGYRVDLPIALSTARSRLLELEEDGFLDLSTRALWIDFALYNVNINRFCTVRFGVSLSAYPGFLPECLSGCLFASECLPVCL